MDEEKNKVKRKPYDDEEEETYTYDVRKPMASLNEEKNSTFDIRKQTGINVAKSVFDKGSIFKTG
ncbi:MAG: hypothetical protein K6A61_07130 [Butyrivibrio sp.]|nr:hypothetical protein [Butyrivibrio sp.]